MIIKINITKLIRTLLVLFIISTLISAIKYPEIYFTTLKYQLANDIKQGNAEAIEYYNRVYIANNKQLF